MNETNLRTLKKVVQGKAAEKFWKTLALFCTLDLQSLYSLLQLLRATDHDLYLTNDNTLILAFDGGTTRAALTRIAHFSQTKAR